MTKERPTLVLACAAAVLFSAVIVAVVYLLTREGVPPLGSLKWIPLSGLLSLCFFVALVHAAIFGIPAFLLVRHRSRITLLRCAAWGFAIGALPLGLLSLLSEFGLQSASTDNIPTVINHVPTLFGLWELTIFVGLLGVTGLVGGCAFWVGLWATGALPVVNRDLPPPSFFGIRSIVALSLVLAASRFCTHKWIPFLGEQ